MKAKFIAISMLSVFTLMGCSKTNTSNVNSSNASKELAPPSTEEALKKAAEDALPKADLSTPDDRYIPITDPMQLVSYYNSLAPIPVRYEKLAELMSADYRSESDEFKKKDIVKALTPQIDAMLAKSKTNRYFIFKARPSLEKYNFEAKGFATGMASDTTWTYSNDQINSGVIFSNADQFKTLAVSDDNVARQIEALRTKYELGDDAFQIYAYAQEADMNGRGLRAQITKIRLVDKNGKILFEQK